MPGSMVNLTARDGSSFGAYLSVPGAPNGSAVIVLQEIFGVNANMRSVADALASEGFVAVVPDLFWRQERGVELDPQTGRERATELMMGLDQELAVEDAMAAADHLRGLDGVTGGVGAVGYCLGGKLAYLLAMRPGIGAAASYYGVGIQGALDRMGEVRCPLLLHVAEEDQLCPPPAQQAIEAAASRHPELVTVLRYPGVGHAFARRASPAFDEASAERADRATLDLLRRRLTASA